MHSNHKYSFVFVFAYMLGYRVSQSGVRKRGVMMGKISFYSFCIYTLKRGLRPPVIQKVVCSCPSTMKFVVRNMRRLKYNRFPLFRFNTSHHARTEFLRESLVVPSLRMSFQLKSYRICVILVPVDDKHGLR